MNDTNSLKVLHILGPLRPSGMERMLVASARHFSSEGVTSVVLGQGTDHPFASDLRLAGYDVRTIEKVGLSFASVRQLRRLATEEQIDVIHIHTEADYLRTVLACRIALGRGGALVRTVHSVFAARGSWRVSRYLQALVADRLVFRVVAPSPDVAENEKTIGRSTSVVYNWVDDRYLEIRAERSARSPNPGLLGLIVGNCSNIKNHERALRAAVSSTHDVIHIGDEKGASAEELALLDQLDAAGRLVARGVRSPEHSLQLADYFMMPSRHEGMGVALAEALVAGVPALISDAPGLQWAKGMSGVIALPQRDESWLAALESGRIEAAQGPTTVDFTAARGAREYSDIYRKALAAT